MNNNKSFVIALALILALIKLSAGYAITDPTQKGIILDKHNEVRRLAANGQISDYGFGKAAKMYPLTWDSKLAETAERWASQCQGGNHDRSGDFGQNVAGGGGEWNSIKGPGVPYEQPQGTPDGCTNCYASANEAIKFRQYSWITGTNEVSSGPDYNSHFTQMVDDDTFRVGCALNTNCPSGNGWGPYYLVCNYYPAGNNGGSAYVITNNAPGSNCPNGASNGLCLGSPQQSGSSGSGGGSTDLPWVNDPNTEGQRFCGNSGSSTSASGSNGVCVYTIRCNDGRSKQFRGSC